MGETLHVTFIENRQVLRSQVHETAHVLRTKLTESQDGVQGPAGIQGIQGIQGPAGIQGIQGIRGIGAGAPTYTHPQLTASASWTIVHNLGGYPSVTVVDSADTVVVGNVRYLSNNAVCVEFSSAFSGSAHLN